MEGRLDIDPDIRRAKTPSAELYTSEKLFREMRSGVFKSSWQWLSAELEPSSTEHAQPFTLLPDCLDEPLLLTRDKDSQLHCISNVCTHRANRMLSDATACRELRCGYHGRRFGLDGQLNAAPGFDQALDFPSPSDHLRSLPLRNLGPLLFCSLNPLLSFGDWIAPVRKLTEHLPWDQLEYAPELQRDFEVKAHWALYVDNYLEGFHVPFVHAGLAKALDNQAYRTELFDWGTLQWGFAREGEISFPPTSKSDPNEPPVAAYYFWLYPNLMLNLYPWGLSLNVVQPISTTKSRVLFRSYVWNRELLNQGAGSDLDRVEFEDEAVVEGVQQGLHSSLYQRGRYSPEHETGVHHFHRLLSSALS